MENRLLPSGKEWDEERVFKYLAGRAPGDEDTVLVSAVKGWGLGRLLELVGQALNSSKQPV